ncbi:hypothetical protein EUGRSUZ_E00635 [Eucalyptus grandis]|uniref:Uncharacterized protein n=2 Tax=Eucalyptus grandis TaxID=71139 RepID=A0ACC3KSC7_EUCGR|nr:hypothetical protein EUGRSUZ_E00635 [Eucalyptus grandis]
MRPGWLHPSSCKGNVHGHRVPRSRALASSRSARHHFRVASTSRASYGTAYGMNRRCATAGYGRELSLLMWRRDGG